MQNPVVPRASEERAARPERIFEARRAVWIVLLIVPLVCIAFVIFRGCSDPFGGSRNVLSAGSVQSGTATIVPLMVAATPVVVQSGPASAITCYMLSDVSFVNGLMPVNSRVTVNGFTYAMGGRVFVADPAAGWIDAGLVKCSGELRTLERSYFVPATATLLPSATFTPLPKSTVTPVRVYVNGPTYTPYPTYTPFPVVSSSGLGVYRESGNCWRFDISGIREIRVNRGDPVAGGSVVCGVKSFTVVVE